MECNNSISSRDENPQPIILKRKKKLIYSFPKFHRKYIFNESAFLVIYCIVLLKSSHQELAGGTQFTVNVA